MPELPDLTVYAKNLNRLLVDRPVVSAAVYNQRQVNTASENFHAQFAGSSIREIRREGKELRFIAANGQSMNVHLMLNGAFSLCTPAEAENLRWKIAALFFEAGEKTAFVISDVQSLCKITLNAPASAVPDALSVAFTQDYFANAVRKNSRKGIKELLIDQHIVRGIGNAYVDEILWSAKISPESVAGKIPEEKIAELHKAVGLVLDDAIASIERITPDIISGEERSFLKVHNKKRQVTPEGEKILIKKVGSKTTYFTESQVRYAL